MSILDKPQDAEGLRPTSLLSTLAEIIINGYTIIYALDDMSYRSRHIHFFYYCGEFITLDLKCNPNIKNKNFPPRKV